MGVNQFFLVKGAMDRIGERRDAEKAAKAKTAEEKRELEIYGEKIDIRTEGEQKQIWTTAAANLYEKNYANNAGSFYIDKDGTYTSHNPYEGGPYKSKKGPPAGTKVYNFFPTNGGALTTEGWQQGVDMLSYLSDDEKGKLNKALEKAEVDGTLGNIPMMQSFFKGASLFADANKHITEDGTSLEKQKVPFIGIPVLDTFLNQKFAKQGYLGFANAKNNKNNKGIFVWQTQGGEYRMGKTVSTNVKEGTILPVNPVIFASKSSSRFFPVKEGIIGKDKYMLVDLYESLGDGSRTRDTAEKWFNLTAFQNNPNYKFKPRRGLHEEDAIAFETNRKEKYGDELYGNAAGAEGIIGAYLERNWNWDGQTYTNGPNRNSDDSTKILGDSRNTRELFYDFLNKWAHVNNMSTDMLMLKGIGGATPIPASFSETFTNLFINLFPTDEDPTSAWSSQADMFLGLFYPKGGDEYLRITDRAMDTLLGPNDVINKAAVYKDTSTIAEARALFGEVIDEDITKAEYLKIRDDLALNDSVSERIRIGGVTSAVERRKAALIAMAYTFASFIQGGKGGTRTVSDADVIFALKALGAVGEDGKILGTANNLGRAIITLKDRATEMAKRVMPQFLASRNEDTSRVPEAVAMYEQIINNLDQGQITDLFGLFGEPTQDSFYSLGFGMSRSSTYGKDSEQTQLDVEVYTAENSALKKWVTSTYEDLIGDKKKVIAMSDQGQKRYTQLVGYVTRLVKSNALGSDDTADLKAKLEALKGLK